MAKKTRKNSLDKNWIRNSVLIAIFFSGIVNVAYYFVAHNASTCTGFFCGFDGYFIGLPVALIFGLTISINLIKTYVTKNWNIVSLALVGTIVTGFPASIILAGFLSRTLAIFTSNGDNYFPVFISFVSMSTVLALSLVFYMRLALKEPSKFITVMIVALVGIIVVQSFFSFVEKTYYNPRLLSINHSNYQKGQVSLVQSNAQKISETGLTPYKPTYLIPSGNSLFRRYSTTNNPSFLELSYGGNDIYEFKVSNKITTSKCGVFDPSLNVGYTIPIHPCIPVGTFNGNTIYYSKIDPIGEHPASSAYYVQIDTEVITLSDYLNGTLNQSTVLQIINSMQPVSALTFASS